MWEIKIFFKGFFFLEIINILKAKNIFEKNRGGNILNGKKLAVTYLIMIDNKRLERCEGIGR